jgi:hypothetical protein
MTYPAQPHAGRLLWSPFAGSLGEEPRAPRRRLRADCQVVRERDFKLVGRRTLDVSDGGMLVSLDASEHGAEGDAPLRPGDAVVVSFRPPRTTRWVDALGVVTRVTKGRRRGDPGPAFGVRLSPIDRGSRDALRVALQRLPEVQPARVRRTPEPAALAIASRFGRG